MSDHRDTVVVKDGGSGAGVILGIIVLIVVLAGAWYLLLGPGATGGSNTQPGQLDVNIELPTPAPAAS